MNWLPKMTVASKVTKCPLRKTSHLKSQVGFVILRLVTQLHAYIQNAVPPRPTPGRASSSLFYTFVCGLRQRPLGGWKRRPPPANLAQPSPAKGDILLCHAKATRSSLLNHDSKPYCTRETHHHVSGSAVCGAYPLCITQGTYLTNILPPRSLTVEIKFL